MNDKERLEILENSIVGTNRRVDELEKKVIKATDLNYAFLRRMHKRKAERQIKKLLKYKIIPVLEKLDLKKMDVWYKEKEAFIEAVKKIRKGLDRLDEWGFD